MTEAISASSGAPAMAIGFPTPTERFAEAPVDLIFLARRSTRAFDDRPIDDAAVAQLLEAARWAPSSSNEQPWFFLWGNRPEERALLLEGLVEPNRRWARGAPLLIFLFARRHTGTEADPGPPNRFAPFDAGAAWMSLALQAHLLGLSAHAMGGVLPERMLAISGLDPEDYEPLVAIAVGHPDPARGPGASTESRERFTPRRSPGSIARRLTPVERAVR